jgi:hypothetical protein
MAEAGGGGGGEAGGGGGSGGGGTGVGDETLVCRATTSTGTEGVACNASDPTTCAAGYSCGEPGDGSEDSVCYKFCNADTDCTSPGGWCHAGPLQTGADEGFTAKTCTLDCDPMAQKGCGAGQQCNLGISTDRTRLYTNCILAGKGGYQAPCDVAEDCQVNFSCLHVSVNGGAEQQMCLQLCTVSPTASACPTGQACQAIPAPDSLGTTQYGWCY